LASTTPPTAAQAKCLATSAQDFLSVDSQVNSVMHWTLAACKTAARATSGYGYRIVIAVSTAMRFATSGPGSGSGVRAARCMNADAASRAGSGGALSGTATAASAGFICLYRAISDHHRPRGVGG
jgi:hypothetical protein